MSVCLSVCVCHRETPTSGCRGDFWSKNIFLILTCDATIFTKRACYFFQRLLKHAVLDQPTVDSRGVSMGRSGAVAVGCWLFALQRHFIGTSMALQQHFNGTSTALLWYFRYHCFYSHRSRDSVSPACGIFFCILSIFLEKIILYVIAVTIEFRCNGNNIKSKFSPTSFK